MIDRRLVNRFVRSDAGRFLRVVALIGTFLVALDACIALNRWWVGEGVGGFQDYQKNLTVMVGGFVFFTVLASRSRSELIGHFLFCVAVYYVCNYEIGGFSKYSLTPFDPIFGSEQTFRNGGPPFAYYRKVMAYGTSILAALTLAVVKLKNRARVSRLGGEQKPRTFNTKRNEK